MSARFCFFMGGPIDLAMFTAARFTNWVLVKLFQFNKGTYDHRITLDKEAAGINTLVSQLATEMSKVK